MYNYIYTYRVLYCTYMLSPIRIAGKCLAVGPANAVGDDGRRTEDPFAKRKNLVL